MLVRFALTCSIGDRPAIPQLQSFGLKATYLLRERGSSMAVTAAGNMANASTATTHENVFEWVKQDKRRMLHVVYRVGDLDRTIKYTSFAPLFRFSFVNLQVILVLTF